MSLSITPCHHRRLSSQYSATTAFLLPLSEVHLKSDAPLLHSNSTHMTVDFIAAAIAYLLGSIPFGYLLVRLFRKEDIRETGSGNIGATNVLRTGSRWLGILTLALDIGKGFLAVEIARHLTSGHHAVVAGSIAAVFAVIGHVFTIWLQGKGGKGVATALGVFLALATLPALSSLLVFILLTLATRYVSLASMLAAASFPVWVWLGRTFFWHRLRFRSHLYCQHYPRSGDHPHQAS